MSRHFKKYDYYTAPEAAVPAIECAREKFGQVPNLIQYMAASPFLVNSYMDIWKYTDVASLDETEQQIVMMTVNRFHECRYCMAGHTEMAKKQGVDRRLINAIRDDTDIKDRRYAVLRDVTYNLVERRGQVSQTLVDAFYSAGFSQQHLLDVIALIGLKTMSNYANHIIGTELEGASIASRWAPIPGR